jgi:hypothetical protein
MPLGAFLASGVKYDARATPAPRSPAARERWSPETGTLAGRGTETSNGAKTKRGSSGQLARSAKSTITGDRVVRVPRMQR